MVIWLIGLSASGKTTIGRKLQALLDGPQARWLLVDGDAFREVMGGDTGHDLEGRRQNAFRISRLCRFLELQDVNVIACVLSLFPDNRKFNRELFAAYREVYVKVDIGILERRDNKGLYAAARSGSIKNVAGVDLPFPEPEQADLVLDNNGDTADFQALAQRVADGLGLQARKPYGYPRPGHAPEKYQYAPYEGPVFLARYREARERAIAALAEKLDRLQAGSTSLRGEHFLCAKYTLPAPAGFFLALEFSQSHRPVRSAPGASAASGDEGNLLVTQDFLLATLAGRDPDQDGLTALLGRFEVTKKVQSAYRRADWKKASGAVERPLDRILLSLALLDGPARDGRSAPALIAFNAVLKINDLIAAEAAALATPAELYLAKVALELELKAYAAWEGLAHA